MTKFLLVITTLLQVFTSCLFAQNGTSVIFDITPYNILSFNKFTINNTNLKSVYMQQGLMQNGQNLTGGDCYRLDNNRITWSPASFLNAQCCIVSSVQTCYPLDRFFQSRVNPSDFILNGVYKCGSPLTGGDYNKFTTNSGGSFISLPFASDNLMQECRGFDIDHSNPLIMYMAHTYFNGVYYNEPRIFKTINGGINWFVTDTIQGIKTISNGGFLKVSPWDPTAVFTVVDDYCAISTNSGYDFVIRTDLPSFKFIVFDEGDQYYHGVAPDNRIWCRAYYPGGSWIPASNQFNILSIDYDPDDHTIWYAGSDNNGVYKSVNAGITFSLFNNSFTPSNKVIGISIDGGTGDTIIVATDKRVYKVWASHIVTSIQPINNSMPDAFSLFQNYPNPFNPTTNIKFQMPKSGFVKLIVYDLLGKEIQTLVNEKLSPGTYEVDFDGSSLPSGVYFYMLESGNFTETKKMMLVK